MSVRGVGRGGKAGGARGASGAGAASKAGGAGFSAKVDKSESLVGASGLVGGSNVGAAGPADPVTAQAMDLVRQLKTGQLKSRDEATKKLVADILRDKVRTQSKKLTEKIFEQLKDDPRLNQTLERLWDRAEEQE
ncbi:MAG TPA: hypothetical protein VGE37_00595 [Archangium sp.]|jgi:hypothetical protein